MADLKASLSDAQPAPALSPPLAALWWAAKAMLAFVEQLSEVNIDGVEPMTSVTPMEMKKRADVVNDGEIADDIVKNAPATEGHFFLVPKVVE